MMLHDCMYIAYFLLILSTIISLHLLLDVGFEAASATVFVTELMVRLHWHLLLLL